MSYSWQQYPQQGGHHGQYGPAQGGQPQPQPHANGYALHMQNAHSQPYPSSYQQPATTNYQGYYQNGFHPQAAQSLPGSYGLQQGNYQGYQMHHSVTHPDQQGPYPAQGNYSQQAYGQNGQQPWAPQQSPYSYGAPAVSGNMYQAPQAVQYPQPQAPKAAQPSSGACYNCGDPSHWAMNCKEPRRALPHGQVAQNQAQANKRHRIPPVITKYPLPAKSVSGAYGPSPNGSNNFQHPIGPYAGPTFSQPPQPPNHYSNWQGSPPNQAANGPSPVTPHSNQQSPGVLNPQHNPASPPQTHQGSQASGTTSRKASLDQSVSMESSPEPDDDDNNDDDDVSLGLLDIPDIPRSWGPIVAKPPVLVRSSLPSILGSDEVDETVRPTLTSDEKIQSKYVNEPVKSALNVEFWELHEEEDRQYDPIFAIFQSRESTPDTESAEHRSLPEQVQDTESPPHRSTTPVYKPEYRTANGADGEYDPFDPSNASFDAALLERPAKADTSIINHEAKLQPPPPPPQQRQHSWSHNGPTYSSNRVNGEHRPQANASSAAEHSSRRPSQSSTSPTDDRAPRKRKLEDPNDDLHRAERRRQHDDFTPKLKRNQPKVAAAYGRRW